MGMEKYFAVLAENGVLEPYTFLSLCLEEPYRLENELTIAADDLEIVRCTLNSLHETHVSHIMQSDVHTFQEDFAGDGGE